ncbi:phosphoglycerate mutase family protein [Collinsella aerofaciens ATCC 25986]|uniref:Histidine phosphatase family protein n=1 Tax=Collinsella aerofaciens (strain ATCC 25986 / DSM 3979 / JCM 10188 / KCTC 3647 / NCTC 11838 / VPI 1003) TaxID=411903 RepID=A4E9J3_COLAA|nr:histidine phosphatase family protein [Collinsella aerofaciens]EBA39938.1 phosphoglycerate mutase family protein [Collinsella aerofaciens ATCC 25986]QIA33747.1 histidine phosphatase family protein [Collinsella aerofaciens ATCC 25986]SUY69453.1 Alpha-ribazole phosphatase [Collinsella aerofaciens]
MKKLYLLRHGQTEFNVKKLVQGRCDSPLTDLGRKQAGMAAAWLKSHDVVPDKVVSSPLGRAMDTAQLVATELLGPDAAVEPCEGIIERCYGSFEEGPHGALPTDVWDPGEDLVPFGGEGNQALQERMVGTLTNLMDSEGIEALLAVSHGSASRQFIKAAAPEGFELPTKLPNCAIMIFDFDEEDLQGESDRPQCKFTLQQIVDPQQSH